LNSQVKVSHHPVDTEELNDLIIDSIQDIKGKNIVKLDLRELEDAPTEYFIICEGDSNTQVKAIADNIYKRVKEEGHTLPSHMEGTRNALWICIDYFSTVVHIFYRETRAFYELEDLWGDAAFTEYESL
jgi:ribosome-associated protein